MKGMVVVRRRVRGINFSQFQDPGKDLFAYLFLVMMVIFLLFMGTQGLNWIKEQQGPLEQKSGGAAKRVIELKRGQVGKLIKQGGKIYLLFNGSLYSPADEEDLARLEKHNHIYFNTGKHGKTSREIYLWKGQDTSISLVEYLNAFQFLSDRHIKVLFVKECES